MAELTREQILSELEDVLRAMPDADSLGTAQPENLVWFGRAVAVLRRWDPIFGDAARTHVSMIQGPSTRDLYAGKLALMTLLHQARADLRLETVGPISSVIGQGEVFDYFDEVRKIVATATVDLLFVDPYLDAEFVSRYLPQAHAGVALRLLCRERAAELVPAARLFSQQHSHALTVRSAPGFHDRYLIVDGDACYQSGASFKDGGRTSPTTITQITDAFAAVRQVYEDIWQNAKVLL